MWATANGAAMVKDLKSRTGAIATALLSRDGVVLFADLPEGVYAETFAIMCATVMGAAVTANRELDLPPPDRVVAEGGVSQTAILSAGPQSILVAVFDRSADRVRVLDTMADFAGALSNR